MIKQHYCNASAITTQTLQENNVSQQRRSRCIGFIISLLERKTFGGYFTPYKEPTADGTGFTSVSE
jgi:hypothetical protein